MRIINGIPSVSPYFSEYPSNGAVSLRGLAKTAAKLGAESLLERTSHSLEGFTNLKVLATHDAVAALAVTMFNLVKASGDIAVANAACSLAEANIAAQTGGSPARVNEAARVLAEASRAACANNPLAPLAHAFFAACALTAETGASREDLDSAACALADATRAAHIVSPQVLATRSLLAARSFLAAETVAVDAIIAARRSI